MEGLTPGRVVHYIPDERWPEVQGRHQAAIVTAAGQDGTASLFVMPSDPGIDTIRLVDVPHDAESQEMGCWHWIERA